MTKDQNMNNEVIEVAPLKKKRKIVSLDRKKARAGWFFVLPFLVGFICLYAPMLIESIKFSFCDINIIPGKGYSLTWVGFENYKYSLFTDPDFTETLVTGLQQMAIDIPAIVIFSLFMAILLNQKMVGRAAFRAIFFIPVVISTGIITTINAEDVLKDYMQEAGSNDGTGGSSASEIVSVMDFEALFSNMKFGTGILEVVTDIINNIFNVVNRSGVQMLIFLAGLQSISPAIYESCKIDGATAWETFWKVTFPMISPMIMVNAVYTVIDAFTTSDNSIMKYISGLYSGGKETISSAMSWMYFLIVILVLAVVALIFSGFVFYQRKDD